MPDDPYAAPKADLSTPVTEMDPATFANLEKENKKLNRNSLLIGGAGILLQFAGRGSLFLVLAGVVLLLIGLSLYASMKGRSKWWGALGLFNLIGLLVLAFPESGRRAGPCTGHGPHPPPI